MTTDFGKWVLKACIDKNTNAKEIAEAIGVSAMEISFIIRGKRQSSFIEAEIKRYLESLPDACKMSDFEKDVRCKLIENDVKLSQLAKIMGISRAAIYYAVTGKAGYDNIRKKIVAYLEYM